MQTIFRIRLWMLVPSLVGPRCVSPADMTEAAEDLSTAGGARYDLLLRGGTVVDGTDEARYEGDLAIAGDRIEAVSAEGIDPAETSATRRSAHGSCRRCGTSSTPIGPGTT